ncbi:hypothetical protein [uncultured Sneathiella sp.]|uniref:hypothetical protein n=1 Tax=uncultured Sneathiella sp. TaxID=879315 RepID=UPI0030ED65CC
MNIEMRITLYWTSLLAVSAFLALASASSASETGSEQDCTEAGVDYKNSGGKTKDEIIAEMDQALFESLNKYDGCASQKKNNASSGGGGGGGATGGSGGGSAMSSASSGIEGSEPMPSQNKTEQQASTVEGEETKSPVKQQQDALPNGKVPEDIPPADNDNILQKKIREAAMNEPDPVKRELLWEEYRKYKGLSDS